MTDEILAEDDLEQKLEELEIWGVKMDKLVTRVEFDNYKDSVFFANAVFSLAASEFHHPEVTVEYGAVEIDLWSHEAGGITEGDIDLARKIEEKVSEIDWE